MHKKWLMLLSMATCSLSWAMSYNPNCCELNGCRTNCGLQGGQIDVWVDALLLQPSSCSFDFAVVDCHSLCKKKRANFPAGDECGLKPDYHWGFRVGANYHSACEELDGSLYYSHLDGSDRNSRKVYGNDRIWPSAGITGFSPDNIFSDKTTACACLNATQRWNAVDGEFGYLLTQGCNFSIRGHVGLHWTNISVNRSVGYRGHFNESKKQSGDHFSGLFCTDVKTWGIGPRFGADFRYNLCYGIGFAARASWGILAGESRHNIEGKNFGLIKSQSGIFCLNKKSRNVVFPEFDTSLGVNYNLCLCNRFDCQFEIGWEFRTYLQSLVHSYPIARAQTATVCDPFNLQGLYLRGMVRF